MLLLTLAAGAFLLAGRRVESIPALRLDTRLELLLPQADARIETYRAFSDAFGPDDRVAIALLETPDDVLSEAFLRRVHAFSEELAALPLVEGRRLISASHVTYTRSQDGWLEVAPLYTPGDAWDPTAARRALAGHPLYEDRVFGREGGAVAFTIPLEPSADTPAQRAALTRALEARFAAFARADEQVWLDGTVVTRPRILALVRGDVARIYPAAGLVLLVVTFLWFRDLRAVLMTFGVVAATLAWTLAVMALTGIPLSMISASVLPVLLLVAGVGDAVHLIAAYRRERARGQAPGPATERALAHTRGPCLLTSLTSAAGFLALLTSDVPLVALLGLPLAIGVVFAFAITFLALPPLLRRGWVSPGSPERAYGEVVAGRIATLVAARPRTYCVLGGLIALASLAALSGLRVESRMLGDFSEEHPLRQTRARFEERLGGVSAIEVFVRPAPGATWAKNTPEGELPDRLLEPSALAALGSFTAALRAPELRAQGVLTVLSLSDFMVDMNHVLLERQPGTRRLPETKEAAAQFLLLYEGATPQDPTTDTLHPDRDRLRVQVRVQNLATPEFFALAGRIEALAREHLPPDLEPVVTGNTAMIQAAHQSLVRNLLAGLGLALLAVFLAVLAGTRDLRLALLGLIPNVIPLLLAGALMALFGVELRLATSVIFCVVFGIAVDDTIHFLAALRQHAGAPSARARVDAALRETGSALVATTAILVAGLSLLALSDVLANRLFGLLSAVALLTALAADLFLLPAILLALAREEAT